MNTTYFGQFWPIFSTNITIFFKKSMSLLFFVLRLQYVLWVKVANIFAAYFGKLFTNHNIDLCPSPRFNVHVDVVGDLWLGRISFLGSYLLVVLFTDYIT
jgi:hypothetical protein